MVHTPFSATTSVLVAVLLTLGAQRTADAAAIPVNRDEPRSGVSGTSSAISSTTATLATGTPAVAIPHSSRIGLARIHQSKSGESSPDLVASEDDDGFRHSSNPVESSVPTPKSAQPAQTHALGNGNGREKKGPKRLASGSVSSRSASELARTALKDTGKFALQETKNLVDDFLNFTRRDVPKPESAKEGGEEGEEELTTAPTTAASTAPGTSHWSGRLPHAHTQIHTHAHSRRNSSKILTDIKKVGKVGEELAPLLFF
ncbi:hypothetical protein GYMLUDRAFT_258575 [Collybiopsis luxurians FD-317 M1]|nr:hypothetical protein GYMLUDRAFT_258575 [Collybiopsis luxurians FD-317 M1]